MSRRLATTAVVGRAVVAVLAAAALLTAGTAAATTPPDGPMWFDGTPVTVRGQGYVDGLGREVVLRGFNVAGEAKLAEYGGLPFADVDEARRSAAAMRRSTGANLVRFLLTWAYVEPAPGRLDQAYLGRFTDQARAFAEAGFEILIDYHQDLYSRYLFDGGSWYTGDGAPQWVVAAGHYPKEFCGICVHWGQNITQNAAVQQATYDFWHDRALATPAGQVGVQEAFLRQAGGALTFIREHLSAAQFGRIIGFDPLNEPYAGRYEPGQTSLIWERDLLWPFYLRFRQRMDAAGWQDKPAFVEPNMFWNSNIGFEHQPGGLVNVGTPGPRFVFNTHFYDHKAMSGVFMWGKAGDGRYGGDFDAIRQHAADLGVPAVVTEFGGPATGYTSDKTPSVVKAMYQALDSRLRGADWWTSAARSGPVLSGTQWHWDTYSGRHHELMNGNPDKVQTTGDAWNGEDFSVVEIDGTGAARLRHDPRLLDRIFPAAVAGRALAFGYEDRARDGTTTLTWNRIPDTMVNARRLVGDGQYAMLVWRSGEGDAPTELHLPATFTPGGTTVVSDLGTVTGPPAYTAHGHAADHPIATAAEPGGGQRLILSAPGAPGTVHFALVTNGTAAVDDALRAATRHELAAWVTGIPFPG